MATTVPTPEDKKRKADEPQHRHPRRDETDPHRKEYRQSDGSALDPHRKDDVKPRD